MTASTLRAVKDILSAIFSFVVLTTSGGVLVDSFVLARRWRCEGSVGSVQAVLAPFLWFIGCLGCWIFTFPYYLWQRRRVAV